VNARRALSRGTPTLGAGAGGFRALYQEHVDALLAYLARRVYDIDIALDLTAESFAQAYWGAVAFAA
jgi:DNA-directed RNA polymerase specialized sigma24 family protein